MYYKKNHIEIKDGATWRNKTSSYLSHALYQNGPEFMNYIKTLFVLGCGIRDNALKREQQNEIFIVVDVHGQKLYGNYINVQKSVYDFYRAIAFFKDQPSYIMDYPYDSGKTGNKHVIVFKIDPDIFDAFVKGHYSKMYDRNFIEKYIPKYARKGKLEKESIVYNVLTKNQKYKSQFVKQLNYEFGTTLTDINDSEYDLPPRMENETLRYV